MKTPVGVRSRGFFLGVAAFWGAVLAGGCATVAGAFDPLVTADQAARRGNLQRETLSAHAFNLTAYSRTQVPGDPLTSYIEGDGRAWLSETRLSPDPTPLHPLVLELASQDPSANVAYLARPCQYRPTAAEMSCAPEYWSEKRFSEEVIEATSAAIDSLAKKAGSSQIHLVGYSGGAAVAVLVAARRSDVVSLRTLAGNLDPDAVNGFHHLPPLSGSLNPLAVAQNIRSVPQRHFVGLADTVVPSFIAERFVQAAGAQSGCSAVTRLEGVTHHKGWTEQWPELLKITPEAC